MNGKRALSKGRIKIESNEVDASETYIISRKLQIIRL